MSLPTQLLNKSQIFCRISIGIAEGTPIEIAGSSHPEDIAERNAKRFVDRIIVGIAKNLTEGIFNGNEG